MKIIAGKHIWKVRSTMERIGFCLFWLVFVVVVKGYGEATPGDTAKFCVAVVQLPSNYAGNFSKIDSFAYAAKQRGADLVVFPEESLFGWLNPVVFQKAQPIPGKFSDQFAAVARKNGIWLSTGIAEQGPPISPGYNEAYDASILIDPYGNLVSHYRQHNVVQNAFDSTECPPGYGHPYCNYKPGPLSDVNVVLTPFGRTALLVCADAYLYDTTTLAALKAQKPDFVIINWGVTDGSQASCGGQYSNATIYASQAAAYLKTAYVVGANATKARPYGRFMPSFYCGTSGFANPSGQIGGMSSTTEAMHLFYIPYPRQGAKPLKKPKFKSKRRKAGQLKE